PLEFFFRQSPGQDRRQLQGDVDFLARGLNGRRAIGRGRRLHGVFEITLRQFCKRVIALTGIEQVAGQHRVESVAPRVDPRPRPPAMILLRGAQTFSSLLVWEDGSKGAKSRRAGGGWLPPSPT